MAVTVDTVKKVTKLARLNVPEADLPALAGELDKIMSWIEQLNEVNTDGVEPLTSAVPTKLPLRADVVTDGHQAAKILQNAPAQEAGFFVVPKIVE